MSEPKLDLNKVGYKQPPSRTRFKKGQSGNPKGRPRNRHRQIPYDTVLGQMVTVREEGREKRITAAEAFLLQLTQKGLAGDSAAARATLAAIEEARAKRAPDCGQEVTYVVLFGYGTGTALKHLNLAIKKDGRDQDKVRWELQPWLIEAALARLGDRRLTEDEQSEVWSNTRTPEKVSWPAWWTVRS